MKHIAVLDLETDPFEFGKMIYPFAAGFYDGETYTSYWGDDCVEKLVKFLLNYREQYIIYAHNGGRFDYFYFLKYIEKSLRIVNGRIIQAYLGKHELRDSYAIMPFPLETYRKTKIDYDRFKRPVRERYRQEIIDYLGDDCRDLYTLVVAFRKEFGENLTIGSAAMKQLKKFHSFKTGNAQYDSRIRKDFYFGGRNQCFASGVIKSPVKIYDVNSMYPHVMKSFLHPVSTGIYEGNKIDDTTCFLTVEGRNYGAFPVRAEDGSLDFTVQSGTFHTTIHEWLAALDTETFKPKRIIKTYGYSRRESFANFVDHFYDARARAKANDDKILTIFYKFVLNSAYGKFAQNPENYADWYITEVGAHPPDWHDCSVSCADPCRLKWTPSFMCEDYLIWEKPLAELNYFNVATGASITGAARSVLLRGIHNTDRPLYVDTDSIICTDGSRLHQSETKLGAWKLEAEGSSVAICGKKLYAVFDGSGECIKKAHKGARLEGHQILAIARGAEIESHNPVPAFKFDGSHTFTQRTIRSTVRYA